MYYSDTLERFVKFTREISQEMNKIAYKMCRFHENNFVSFDEIISSQYYERYR